eukprot:gene6621-6849_t
MSTLSGHQLSGLLAALAGLKVGLNQPLGPRALDGKVAVTYGELILAAIVAAADPNKLPGLSAAAVAQLLRAVACLGVQPSPDWTAAMCGQLQGQVDELSSEALLGLLEAVTVLGAAPGGSWLQEASEAVINHYSREPDSRTLAERQKQAAAAVEVLIRCSSALVLLGAQMPPALQALLLQVVPERVGLQQGPSPAAAALLAAGTEAILCGSEGRQPDAAWGGKLAAAVAAVLPVAGGADCCRLAVCLASAGVQLGQHQQLRSQLLQQLEDLGPAVPAGLLMKAITALVAAGARPTPHLANSLVIKTQKQLALPADVLLAPAAATPGDAARTVQLHSRASSTTLGTSSGSRLLNAADLAAVAWSLAFSGVKVSSSWQRLVLQQLGAAAHRLPAASLHHLVVAASKWSSKGCPANIIQAVQSLTAEQVSHLTSEQILGLADAVVAAGRGPLSQALEGALPQNDADDTAGAAAARSLSSRARAAAVVERLWQEVSSAKKALADDSTDIMGGIPAAVLQSAAAELKDCQAAELCGYLSPLERWSTVLQVIATQQQLQTASITDVLAQPDVRGWLQQVAVAVQTSPADTARGAAGGPATLCSLAQLGLEVSPSWVSALQLDLDLHSSSIKSSWYRNASAAAVQQYLTDLGRLGQQISGPQFEAICKTMPAKVHQLTVPQQVQLLQMIAQFVAATNPSRPALQQQKQKQRLELMAAHLVRTLLQLVLSAVARRQLGSEAAVDIVSSIFMVGANLCLAGDSSATGDGMTGAVGDMGGGIGPVGSNASDVKRKGRRSVSQAQRDSTQVEVEAVAVSALLEVALGASYRPELGSASDFFLGCLRLACVLPLSSTAAGHLPRIWQLVVRHVSLCQEGLAPAIAAEVFCATATLVFTTHKQLATGARQLDSELAGCMMQLLEDAQADWSQVRPSELVALPKQVAALRLPWRPAAAYFNAVGQHLTQFADSSSSSIADVQEAVAAGSSPARLLDTAVWLVMDGQPAEPGNTTHEGLQHFIAAAGTHDRQQLLQGSKAGGAEGPLLPVSMFHAAWAAMDRVSSSLPADDLASALHCYFMAGDAAAPPGAKHAWLVQALQTFSHAGRVVELSPSQQLVLLRVCAARAPYDPNNSDSQTSVRDDMLQAVLSGSLRSQLSRWQPTMLPYGLSLIGAMALDYPTAVPGRLLSLMQQWQAAALEAVLQNISRLPAASHVQLLLAYSRLKLAAGTGSTTVSVDEKVAGPGAVEAPEGVGVSLQYVSQELDELQPELLIQLMQALSKLELASQGLGEAIMAKLQPHLRSLSLSQLSSTITSFARWPPIRRPRLSVDWVTDFLAASSARLSAACAALLEPQQCQQEVELMGDGGPQVAEPDVRLPAPTLQDVAPDVLWLSSIHSYNEGLFAEVLRVLPKALRALSWPADQELVAGFVQHMQLMLQQLQQRHQQLSEWQQQHTEQLQDELHKSSSSASGSASRKSGGLGGQRKQRQQSKQHKLPRDVPKQQAEHLLKAVQEEQVQTNTKLQLIEDILKDWQIVQQQSVALAPGKAVGSGDPVPGQMSHEFTVAAQLGDLQRLLLLFSAATAAATPSPQLQQVTAN